MRLHWNTWVHFSPWGGQGACQIPTSPNVWRTLVPPSLKRSNGVKKSQALHPGMRVWVRSQCPWKEERSSVVCFLQDHLLIFQRPLVQVDKAGGRLKDSAFYSLLPVSLCYFGCTFLFVLDRNGVVEATEIIGHLSAPYSVLHKSSLYVFSFIYLLFDKGKKLQKICWDF